VKRLAGSASATSIGVKYAGGTSAGGECEDGR
jgi:hypothetical protein